MSMMTLDSELKQAELEAERLEKMQQSAERLPALKRQKAELERQQQLQAQQTEALAKFDVLRKEYKKSC